MNYHWINREEVLWKAKEIYSKEKAAEKLLRKQRSNNEKINGSIQKCAKERKRQD